MCREIDLQAVVSKPHSLLSSLELAILSLTVSIKVNLSLDEFVFQISIFIFRNVP